MTLADRILELRKQKGISQEELADKLIGSVVVIYAAKLNRLFDQRTVTRYWMIA